MNLCALDELFWVQNCLFWVQNCARRASEAFFYTHARGHLQGAHFLRVGATFRVIVARYCRFARHFFSQNLGTSTLNFEALNVFYSVQFSNFNLILRSEILFHSYYYIVVLPYLST